MPSLDSEGFDSKRSIATIVKASCTTKGVLIPPPYPYSSIKRLIDVDEDENVTVSEDGSTKAVTLVTEKKLAAKDGFTGEVLAAVLPSGGVLASSNYLLLRSGKDDETYSTVGGDNGLHTAIMQSDAEGVPSFMRFAVAAKVHRVFVGGYTGVYRSDNGGQTWIKLDTIAPFITHLVVAPGRGDADFSVAACTYTAGCFQGGVSVKDGKAKMTNAKGDDSLAGASMSRILMPA